MARLACGIERIISAPFEQVCYLVWRHGSDEAFVVDPGFDTGAIASILQRERLRLVAILNTHGHADHIAGNARMKAAHPEAPLIIGRNEAHLLTSPEANLSAGFGVPLTSPAADRLVDDGERIEIAGIPLEVREIPGHSPGSVVFIAHDCQPAFVLGGDVLFAGSVGRFDFPGGSSETLFSGIRQKLFNLPDGFVVLPGHGPPTTIGEEKAHNPYVGESASQAD